MTKKFLLLFSTLILACSTPSKEQAVVTPAEPVQIAAVDTSKPLQKIAFGSCAHQKKPQPIWTTIAAAGPDLYIGLGDNVYASKPEDQPIAEAYRLQSQVPEFKAFRAKTPVIGVWDDHDFGSNDGGAENPLIGEAKAAYTEFFPADAKMIPADRKGVYHSFVFGESPRKVQIVLLDTRTYRSPLEKNPAPAHPLDIFQATKDTTKTILGEEQWKWLEEELKKPADLRLVVTSIQMLPDEHGFEKWANFPHERARFLDLLKKLNVRNAVLLSGDRHLGEISKEKLPQIGELHEVTASGINRPSNLEGEKNSRRLGRNYLQANFGWAQIDWDKREVHFELRDQQGQRIQGFNQKLPLIRRLK